MTTGEWFERGSTTAGSDNAGAMLRAWRTTNQRSQVQVAAALEMTQQHLSAGDRWPVIKPTRP